MSFHESDQNLYDLTEDRLESTIDKNSNIGPLSLMASSSSNLSSYDDGTGSSSGANNSSFGGEEEEDEDYLNLNLPQRNNNNNNNNNKSKNGSRSNSQHHNLNVSGDGDNHAALDNENDNDNDDPRFNCGSAGASKKTNLPLLSATYMGALTTGATTYAFSFYSNALKTSLHLSQNQLDTLSSATFCAGILSWMPGMMVDLWGARRAMALGGFSNTVMLSLYWLIATQTWKIQDIDLLILVLSTLGVLTFVGCALVTGSVFKVIVESCGSGTKGQAVGCAKGYVGVGSGVYVCLFGALFGSRSGGGGVVAGPERGRKLLEDGGLMMGRMIRSFRILSNDEDTPQNPELNSLNFLLMAAALSLMAATLPALFLLPKQTTTESACAQRRDGTRKIHFRVIYAGLIGLGIWVVGTSLLELKEESDEKKNQSSSSSSVAPSFMLDSDSRFLDADSHNYYFSAEDELSWSRGQSSEEKDFPKALSRQLWTFTRKLASSSSPERHWGTAMFLLLLWWGPALSLLCIPPRNQEYEESRDIGDEEELYTFDNDETESGLKNNHTDVHNNNNNEEETFLQEDVLSRRSPSRKSMDMSEDTAGLVLGSDHTMTQMLRTGPAWLMAWTCVIIVGGGTVMTNNIGQMTEALGFDPNLTSASLALFSAAQAASRVVTGSISESALSWDLPWWFCGCLSGGGYGRYRTNDGLESRSSGLPRPAFLVAASVISAASHFILAIATTEEGFAFGVTLSGVAFGMVWPLMVLITGELFGLKNYGANYMFYDGFSSAAGTLLLSKFVAQTVYDEHIAENHGDPGTVPMGESGSNFKCYGTDCFRMSHVIVSFLSLTCIVSSIGLIWSTKAVYHRR